MLRQYKSETITVSTAVKLTKCRLLFLIMHTSFPLLWSPLPHNNSQHSEGPRLGPSRTVSPSIELESKLVLEIVLVVLSLLAVGCEGGGVRGDGGQHDGVGAVEGAQEGILVEVEVVARVWS